MAQTLPAGVIAVIRTQDPTTARTAALGLLAAGVPGVEITLTVPTAVELLAELSPRFGSRLGAGTVLTAAQASACVAAGAGYLVSPCTDPAVLRAAAELGTPMVPGAATPTEIAGAHRLGAAAVKVFPATLLGGVDYIRAVREPLPEPQLVISGGATAGDVGRYLDVGVLAVCLGREIIDDVAARAGDVEGVAVRASAVLRDAGITPLHE